MTSEEKDQLQVEANRLANEKGILILHFIIRGTDSRPVFEIVLDAVRPILVEDCEFMSRSLLDFLESTKAKNTNYRLDVLSPGIDEPLQYDYQLQRSIGKTIELETTIENGGNRVVGELLGFDSNTITMAAEQKRAKGQQAKTTAETIIERSFIATLRQVAVIR